MAYSTGSPPACMVRSDDGSTPALWSYRSTDGIDTVSGSGYISNALNLGMRVGDYVMVTESDTGYVTAVMTVASMASGAATLTDNGGRQLSPGVGITGAVGGTFDSAVTRQGGIILTRILIDLTGLNSGGTAGDIIGTNGSGVAYLGQITAAVNGTIIGGRMVCLEAPAGGDTDIDLYAATVATGVEDAAISGLSGQTQVINSGAQSLGTASTAIADSVAANSYLYLVGQGTANATYTAGRLMIELYGI